MSEIMNQDRITKSILFIQGSLDELKANKYVEGGNTQLTEKGYTAYLALKASGFRPTKEEIALAMETIQSKGRLEGYEQL